MSHDGQQVIFIDSTAKEKLSMNKTTRKIFAVILLLLLVVVPFLDWKLGAVLWMCVWLVFIFQKLFSRHDWQPHESDKDEKKPE